MAVSPIDLRGIVSTQKRYVTISSPAGNGSVAVLEAPAVIAGLDDVAIMRQAIEHRDGHPGVAEHLLPTRPRRLSRQPTPCAVSCANQVLSREKQATSGKNRQDRLLQWDQRFI